MVEDGAFALDTPLGDVLPEARAAAPGVTIGRLLSHTSGLPLDLPPGAVDFALGPDWPEMARAALRVAPAHAPGERVQYSNVAYYLLGLAAERVTGQPFRERLHATVFGPLGIEAYFREPLPDRVMTVGDADSDWVGTPREPYNSNFFRTWGLPASSVVTNAAGLLRLVQAYAGQGGVIRPDTAALARSDVAGEIPGGYATTDAFVGFRGSRAITWPSCAWGLGVEVQGGKVPHWAPASAPRSFGQIGSSGCLAWCDPDAGAAWCVLGTRTTDSGWLVRYGAGIARAALTAVREASRAADAPGRGARATVQIG
jgi:CubicO group peptidase (beta-lactamase class C family)